MSSFENADSLTPEELLAPPKYDAIGVLMAIISSLIVGVVVGVIILLCAYLTLGNFSLDTGVSPILLAMITFFALVIGNLIYYTLLAKIFPHIYARGRTALAQIVTMSIILYLLFAPVYIAVSALSRDTSGVLWAFAGHVVLSVFAFQMIIAIISQYRYSLLSVYASIASLLVTMTFVVFVFFSLSNSSTSLFLLFGLSILTYLSASTISFLISWIYYLAYVGTGSDVVGSIFSRIEMEEKSLEKQATEALISFHK